MELNLETPHANMACIGTMIANDDGCDDYENNSNNNNNNYYYYYYYYSLASL